MPMQPTIRFAAIGLNHGHIFDQTRVLLEAGAELVWVYAPEEDLLAAYRHFFPQAKPAPSAKSILEDPTIQLIISAGIPCDRAPLGIEAMRHGKDYMVDKPGATSMAQLEEVRRVQRETGRIYSIYYSERLGVRASVKAGQLVHSGAIGQVVQVTILAPHHERPHTRPAWFYDPAYYGGILTDIGSHQLDQVLYYTGSTQAEIAYSQVGNFNHPQQPLFEDFGDAVVRGNGGLGYVRVDWFTPEGLGTWGDGRLTIIGTDGYIEARKYIDIAGRPGGDHLFLIDHKGTQYIDCKQLELPYARQLISDIVNRTETAMTHDHCFLAMEMTLHAQARAQRLGHLTQRGES